MNASDHIQRVRLACHAATGLRDGARAMPSLAGKSLTEGFRTSGKSAKRAANGVVE